MNLASGRRTGGAWRPSFLLALLLLLVLCSTVSAQPVETSPRPSTDWKTRYYSLAQKVLRLEKAWDKQKIDFETAQELVASLRTSLDLSQQAVARSIRSSESLQTRLDVISAQIKEVERAAKAAIVRASVIWGLIGVAAGLLAGILIE